MIHKIAFGLAFFLHILDFERIKKTNKHKILNGHNPKMLNSNSQSLRDSLSIVAAKRKTYFLFVSKKKILIVTKQINSKE